MKTLSLILPVLLPSWRFFKTVEPSPRVQWAFVAQRGMAQNWHEYRPRPHRIALWRVFIRLFYNAARNDALFVVSCAERIEESPTDHSIAEITRRIRVDILATEHRCNQAQFRLVFVSCGETEITQEVLFVSAPFATS